MSRAELEFQVAYSMHLEDLMRTLLGRLDRIASLLQIVLGVTVVTAEAPKITGILVAFVAAFQLVWQPGVKAGDAKTAFERWSCLFREMASLTDLELGKRINEAAPGDSAILGALKPVAHRAAAIQLGLELSDCPLLTRWQKFVGRFAGGLVQ